ncbi:MAG TPA: polysaccharide deacetylase family protein [Candidatus Paceibacterota bacterium]|nr:polysaccharide deacetylase family protein [Candidatus Paceibacterota bacterium]
MKNPGRSAGILIAACAAAVLFIGGTAIAGGPNLIANPSLDNGTSGWNTEHSGSNISVSFNYPVKGFSGNAVKAQITKYKNSGDAYWQSPAASVAAGKSYLFSGYSLSNVSVNVIAIFTKNNGSSVTQTLGTVSGTGAWQQFSATVTIPSGYTKVRFAHELKSIGYVEVDQYSLTEAASTSTPPPPPVQQKPLINSFVTSSSTIVAGQQVTLSWNVSNASSTSIDQNVGIVTGASKQVTPTQTTTYTLTATNPAGVATSSVTVTVVQPAPPTPPTQPNGPNLIANGNLEAGTANNPTGWNADYWGTMNVKFTYPVAGKGGGKAAQVAITKYSSGDAKWDFDHVPVSSHTIYTFTDDYNSTLKDNVTVEYLMSDGTYQYDWVADAPATNGTWQTLTAQVTVPTGAVSLTVLHTIAAVGTLTIDNASLTANPQNPLPSGMVALTFDDGDLSQYQNALPILNAAGMRASFYIITSEPGSGDSGYMTWAQIKNLASQGFEIGGHTQTHPYLTTLTSAQAQKEIAGSYSDLVKQGITPTTFVYPYGDRSPSTDAMVAAAGYSAARGSYYGLNEPGAPRYNLDDIRVDSSTSLASLEAEIDQAVADKRLLILEIHDVLQSGGDEYAITPSFLQSLVNYIKQSGIKVVTLNQAIGSI